MISIVLDAVEDVEKALEALAPAPGRAICLALKGPTAPRSCRDLEEIRLAEAPPKIVQSASQKSQEGCQRAEARSFSSFFIWFQRFHLVFVAGRVL